MQRSDRGKGKSYGVIWKENMLRQREQYWEMTSRPVQPVQNKQEQRVVADRIGYWGIENTGPCGLLKVIERWITQYYLPLKITLAAVLKVASVERGRDEDRKKSKDEPS